MCKIPKLFEIMDVKKISAKQLSIDTGISTGNISDWKSGRSRPSIDTLAILAAYFNVSTDYLLGNEQKEKPAAESDELDPLDIEFLKRFKQLDDEGKNLVSAQIDAIIAFRQQKK
jgi:transcriptional regulator with XRE-family HTH domain